MARYSIYRECSTCDGDGELAGADGSNVRACHICNGAGKVKEFEVEDLDVDISDIKDKLDDIWEKLNE